MARGAETLVMEIFGSSGVRGVANEYLNPEFVTHIATAAGSVWDADRVALARDTRATGEMLSNAAAAGLASAGCDVDRLGVLPTPGLQAYCEAEGTPGLMVTASHNPPAYNGVKLVGADGVELPTGTLERVEERLLTEEFETVPWSETGDERRVEDAADRYVDQLLAAVDGDRVADADLTVALDPGHGAGAATSPRVFRELGCEVVTVNAQPDGRFPGRDPEPVAENLADLGRLVRTTDADLGVAHDGDADRARGVAADGSFLSGDVLLAVLAAASTSAGDRVAVPVDTSLAVEDFLADRGVETTRTPVGDVHVAAEVAAGAAFGGEPSGAWIWPDETLCPDGPLAAVRLAELAAERPLAERAAAVPTYPIRRDSLRATDKRAVMDRVRGAVVERYEDVSTMDGLRVATDDGWFLLRASGTQPLVRVTAEARDPGRAEDLFETAQSLVVDAGAETREG